DNEGASSASTDTVSVTLTNIPPVAKVAGPVQGSEGSVVFADATQSSDIDGTIANYHVDWGDGSPADDTPSSFFGHVYANQGTYPIVLTVTDDAGASSSATTTATIDNVAPTVTLPEAVRVSPGAPRTFTASVSDPGVNDIINLTWDFGDGS